MRCTVPLSRADKQATPPALLPFIPQIFELQRSTVKLSGHLQNDSVVTVRCFFGSPLRFFVTTIDVLNLLSEPLHLLAKEFDVTRVFLGKYRVFLWYYRVLQCGGYGSTDKLRYRYPLRIGSCLNLLV